MICCPFATVGGHHIASCRRSTSRSSSKCWHNRSCLLLLGIDGQKNCLAEGRRCLKSCDNWSDTIVNRHWKRCGQIACNAMCFSAISSQWPVWKKLLASAFTWMKSLSCYSSGNWFWLCDIVNQWMIGFWKASKTRLPALCSGKLHAVVKRIVTSYWRIAAVR